MLTLAATGDPFRLVDWREGKSLFDSVEFMGKGGMKRLPFRPDAFFTIEDTRRPEGKNRIHYFLEADRSTATHARFSDKILAYWHYREQGQHGTKFQIKTFRVLTVTITRARAAQLAGLAAKVFSGRGGKSYLFASLQDFPLDNPAAMFEPVYITGRPFEPDSRVPLVPAIGASDGVTSAK